MSLNIPGRGKRRLRLCFSSIHPYPIQINDFTDKHRTFFDFLMLALAGSKPGLRWFESRKVESVFRPFRMGRRIDYWPHQGEAGSTDERQGRTPFLKERLEGIQVPPKRKSENRAHAQAARDSKVGFGPWPAFSERAFGVYQETLKTQFQKRRSGIQKRRPGGRSSAWLLDLRQKAIRRLGRAFFWVGGVG